MRALLSQLRPDTRISRGFHRIGIVLAVIPLLIAALFAAQEWRHPSGAIKTIQEMSDAELVAVAKANGITPNDHTTVSGSTAELVALPRKMDVGFVWPVAALCLSIYGAFRTLGWIVNGFG